MITSRFKNYLRLSLKLNKDSILKRVYFLAFSLAMGKVILITLNSEISAVLTVAAAMIFGIRGAPFKYPLSGSWDYRSSLPLPLKEYVGIKLFEYVMLYIYSIPGLAFMFNIVFDGPEPSDGGYLPELIMLFHVALILVVHRLFEKSLPPFNLPKKKTEGFNFLQITLYYFLIYIGIEFFWISAMGCASFVVFLFKIFKKYSLELSFSPVIYLVVLVTWVIFFKFFFSPESRFFNERNRFKRLIKKRQRTLKDNSKILAILVSLEVAVGLFSYYNAGDVLRYIDSSKTLFPVAQNLKMYFFLDAEEFRAKRIFSLISSNDVKAIHSFSEREFELSKKEVKQGISPSLFALLNQKSEIADILMKNGHQPFQDVDISNYSHEIPKILATGDPIATRTFLMGLGDKALDLAKEEFSLRVVKNCRYANFYFIHKKKGDLFDLNKAHVLDDYMGRLSTKILAQKNYTPQHESCFILLGYIYKVRKELSSAPLPEKVKDKVSDLRRRFIASRIFFE